MVEADQDDTPLGEKGTENENWVLVEVNKAKKLSKQIFQTLLRTDTRVIQKTFNETFSNPLTIEKQTF